MQVDSLDSQLPILNAFSSWTKSGLDRTADLMGSLINFPLEHSNTEIRLIPTDRLVEDIGISGKSYYPYDCFIQSIDGSIQGFFLFTGSSENISIFVEYLKKSFIDGNCNMYIDERSVIQEWTNIFSGNMLSEIDSTGQSKSWLSIPEDTYDMYGSVLSFIASQMSLETDLVLTCFSTLSSIQKNTESLENKSKENGIKSSNKGSNKETASLDFWLIANPNSEIFQTLAKNKVSKLNKLIYSGEEA